MKCRVCGDKAAVRIRRHNAAFCREHVIEHLQRQVARAIEDYQMFTRSERLLLGVSGGKDSLSLWDMLTDLGYRVDGVYLHLGIGDYSSRGKACSEGFARRRGLELRIVDLPGDYGFSVPEAARATRRSPCSACGLSKRYILNEAAVSGGYDVLVMGHNLDDEAATLFGNVVNWNVEYLARQRPVLPATGTGFVRKVKPLIRIAERETAAYAVLKGIEYEVEECPMVAGNTINRIKEWLTTLEQESPGLKQQFLFGFLERAAGGFEAGTQPELRACQQCGRPTTAEVCAFCRLQRHTLEAPVGERDDG